MATKQELEQKLRDLQESLDAVPDDMKKDIQDEIESTQKELESTSDSAPMPMPEAEDDFMKTLIASMSAIMQSGENTGVDSPTIRGKRLPHR